MAEFSNVPSQVGTQVIDRRSTDMIFLVDISRSIKQKDSLSRSIEGFLAHFPGEAHVSLVTFGEASTLVIDSNVSSAQGTIASVLDGIESTEGTDVCEGICSALHLLEGKPTMGEVSLIIVTDGYATRGTTDCRLIVRTIRQQISTLRARPTIFTFGVGRDVLSLLLCDVSEISDRGAYFYAPNPTALDCALDCCAEYIISMAEGRWLYSPLRHSRRDGSTYDRVNALLREIGDAALAKSCDRRNSRNPRQMRFENLHVAISAILAKDNESSADSDNNTVSAGTNCDSSSKLRNLLRFLQSHPRLFRKGGVHALRAACHAHLRNLERIDNFSSVMAWLEEEARRTEEESDSQDNERESSCIEDSNRSTNCSHIRNLVTKTEEVEEEILKENLEGSSNKAMEDSLLKGRYEHRYDITSGAYGTIRRATDVLSGTDVAVKLIPSITKDRSSMMLSLRELHLLRCLSNHPNIITLRDAILDEHNGQFDLLLIMDLKEIDLQQLIDSSQVLSHQHHLAIMHQLTLGLDHMHSVKVAHRDLKPSNVLLDGRCRVYLADFGLARKLESPTESTDLNDACGATEYVVTRWYRAPEALLSCPYGLSIDIWSLGCIFAEIINRTPLFPGKDYVHQIKLICGAIEIPDNRKDEKSTSLLDEAIFRYLQRYAIRPRTDFPRLLSIDDHDLENLLRLMLHFDPLQRIDTSRILKIGYLPNDDTYISEPPLIPEYDNEPTLERLEAEVRCVQSIA